MLVKEEEGGGVNDRCVQTVCRLTIILSAEDSDGMGGKG